MTARHCPQCRKCFTAGPNNKKFCSVACKSRYRSAKMGPAYKSWANMKQRCQNTKHPRYADYGGRGIRVCVRWRAFANFLADMGPQPIGAELERRDNNKSYCPGNCEWATAKQQQRNKRDTHFITAGRHRQSLAAWAEETGIPVEAIRWRVSNGWPVHRALSEMPVLGRNQYGV